VDTSSRPEGRTLWGATTLLALLVLAGISLLGVRLRPYWVARYRGVGANLRGAVLIHARLQGVNLAAADLRGANLRNADLRGATLLDADLRGADLRGADLRGTALDHITDVVSISIEYNRAGRPGRVNTRGEDPDLIGARYDSHTRWSAGFDPVRYGAIRVDSDHTPNRGRNR
jgi:hypothetical protein